MFFANDTTSVIFPAPLGTVSDFDEILEADQIRSLDSIIVLHERKHKSRISIVTVGAIRPYTDLHEYSVDLLDSWKSDSEKGNSVLIVYSPKIGEANILVGSNLKKRLTDKESKRILKKTMEPEFEKGEYYTGLRKALQKIVTEIK